MTWDEFQTVVQKLVEEKKCEERSVDGGWEIGLAGAGSKKEKESVVEEEKDDVKSSLTKPNRNFTDAERKPPTPSANYDTKRMEKIPTMVARHLIKLGQKKKKNIELNTKTRLKILGDFATNVGGEVDLEISGESEKRYERCEESQRRVVNTILALVLQLRWSL